MTCQTAFSAVQTHRPNGDAPAFFQSCRNISGDASDFALITRVMRALNSPPPLVLTTTHQRQALILDRDRAAQRMDTQQVHRLESDPRKLTTKILKGN